MLGFREAKIGGTLSTFDSGYAYGKEYERKHAVDSLSSINDNRVFCFTY